MKIKRQTLGAPLLETFLYISVFGAALGSRIDTLHGFDYVVFIIPGLIMMAWAINAFSTTPRRSCSRSSSARSTTSSRSPASPLELLLAFSLGGFLRGMIVAAAHVRRRVGARRPAGRARRWCWSPSLFLVGFFFAQLGVLVGVRAEQFDDVSFAQTFVLQPLIFLGGVFYSASLLPEPFETLTHFNPVYYMIAPRALRLPRLHRGERRALADAAHARHRRAVPGQPPAVRARLPAARLTSRSGTRARFLA